MSEIEMNERDRLNQLLCAYVLGEAGEAECAEIEAALVKDSSLREERARLEATIGLVKSSLGKDETLSYRATSEVTRAAAQMAQPLPSMRRGGAWYQSSSLRIAASIVAVVGGGFLGWRAFVRSHSDSKMHRSLELALAPVQTPPTNKSELRTAKNADDDTHIRPLGYSSGSELDSSTAQPVAGKPIAVPLNAPPSERAGDDVKDQLAYKRAEESLVVREKALKEVKLADGTAPSNPDVIYAIRAGGQTPGIIPLDLNRFGQPTGSGALDSKANPQAGSGEPIGGIDELVDYDHELQYANRGQGGSSQDVNESPELRAQFLNNLKKGTVRPRPVGPGSPGSSGPSTPGAVSAGESRKKSAEVGRVGDKDGADVSFDPDPESTLDFLGANPNREVPSQEAGTEFERLDRQDKSRVSGGSDDYYLGKGERQQQRRILTPEEREARIEQLLASCRLLPNERPRDMFFRFWGDNPFEWTANDRLSTFSMDVDTASYTLARKYLVENQLPEKAQIRTEEFVNYFKPDVAPPTKGTFAIVTELAPSRFSNPIENKWMLRVAVRGVEVPKTDRLPLELTFVIDVSGSMAEGRRLELVKSALRQLVGQLDARDSIAIVAFSNDARLILPMTSAAKRALIESAIQPLQPENSTNTEAGLRMGYEQALSNLTKNATNRVVLLTDGVANEGVTDPNVLAQTVERQRKAGIYLNTIGVGMNNHNDNLLEQLADKGDGLCNYVDDEAEVKHALVDNFLQTMVPIARDAKVQVEFDPAQVQSYRLLGYENRAIADQDFRNDKVDAGEINSGHQVTAMYEIVCIGNLAQQDAPLAKVRVRYKPPYKGGIAQPGSEEATEMPVKPVFAKEAAGNFEATSFGYRRAVLAAQFAEFLRRSVHARGDSLDQLIADLQKLVGEKPDTEVAELSDMVMKSKALLEREFARRGELDSCVYQLRQTRWERERCDAQKLASDRELIRTYDAEIASLEGKVRTLLEQRLK